MISESDDVWSLKASTEIPPTNGTRRFFRVGYINTFTPSRPFRFPISHSLLQSHFRFSLSLSVSLSLSLSLSHSSWIFIFPFCPFLSVLALLLQFSLGFLLIPFQPFCDSQVSSLFPLAFVTIFHGFSPIFFFYWRCVCCCVFFFCSSVFDL